MRGAEALVQAGVRHARPAVLCGLGTSFLSHQWPAPDAERDIDVLFIGSIRPISQRERLAWLGRLASLADRHNVVIRSGVSETDYRDLLGRAKIVFNHSAWRACNRRVFEAAAAGALLLQEQGNAAVASLLRPGEEYVEYDESNLEQVIDQYLANDSERIAIASAAAKRAAEFSFERLFLKAIEALEEEWDELQARAAARAAMKPSERLRARAALAISHRTANPTHGSLKNSSAWTCRVLRANGPAYSLRSKPRLEQNPQNSLNRSPEPPTREQAMPAPCAHWLKCILPSAIEKRCSRLRPRAWRISIP